MKKSEVKTGGTYLAKVSDKVVPVRLDRENPHGGWDATNMATNKQVRIKSAQRLRGTVRSGEAKPAEAPAATKPAAKEPKAATKQRTAKGKDGEAKPKRVSLIDAAFAILGSAKEPMNCKTLVEQVTAKGTWTPGKGKTPEATLYSAILREIQKDGKQARFVKASRGQFITNPKAA